jgi:arylsulfatase A-like enzyme
MNVIWIVADTFRRDHLGAYGNQSIVTPSLDALAARSTRFDRHYIAAFPTMPARADHRTGRWTMSFMGWGALGNEVKTLGHILTEHGHHTAAVSDVPFYWRHGMNYDAGFQTFFPIQGQEGSGTRVHNIGHNESRDVRAWWSKESDHNVARTMVRAGEWLELHYKEDFFLYVDTWDPHEPWDAPAYYTELYAPDFDGERVDPPYCRWQDAPGMTQEKVLKARATYAGSVTMVDTWIGHLLRKVDNMGLREKTAVIFTTDHGFYIGEHDGMFGKMMFAMDDDGAPFKFGDPRAQWQHSPLYEEIVAAPLLISLPEAQQPSYSGITSAVDVMPTVLDLVGVDVPGWVEGRSLAPMLHSRSAPGRDFTVSTIPFADVGQKVRSVDNVERTLASFAPTTVSTEEWSLVYSPEPGLSELFHLPTDPGQTRDRISSDFSVARELHVTLLDFMEKIGVPRELRQTRATLRI